MTSFVTLSTCAPCSSPIDDTYADAIRAYQREIRDLKGRVRACEQECQSMSQSFSESEHENRELSEKINVLERINHHLSRELSSAHKRSGKMSSHETQTDNDEFLQLQTENENLKAQSRKMVKMMQDSIQKQQDLMDKINTKREKIEKMRALNETISQQLNETLEKNEELDHQVTNLSDKFHRYKTENKRLVLRLAETEGNLSESENSNSRLRQALNSASDKQQLRHSQDIVDMSARLFETEQKLQDAEAQVAELSQAKKELLEVTEKLNQSRAQCKQLAETLKHTQAFLLESKRQLIEGVDATKEDQGRQLVQMKARYEESNAHVRALQDKIDELQKELSEIRMSQLDVQNSSPKLASELKRLRNIESLYKTLLTQVSEKEGERSAIADLQSENERLRLKIDVSELENANLSSKLTDMEVRNRELERQLKELSMSSTHG